MGDRDYALVIGISEYPAFNPLRGPVNDAQNFASWLRKPASEGGGGVPDANLRKVLSPQPRPPWTSALDAVPIVDDVTRNFQVMRQAILNTPEEQARRLYLFFAGHGFAPDPDETALLLANADIDSIGFHIAGRKYAEYFRLKGLAEEIVLIMDCCRDIELGMQANSVPWPLIITEGSGRDVRLFYAFATKWSSKSREKPTPKGDVQGLFTRALLDGLNNGMNAPNGRITGALLKNHIHNLLPMLCSPDPCQGADINIGTATPDIVFVEGAEAVLTPVRITTRDPQEKILVQLIDGKLNLIQEHEISVTPWDTNLEPGFYALQSSDGSRILQFRAVGKETVDVQY